MTSITYNSHTAFATYKKELKLITQKKENYHTKYYSIYLKNITTVKLIKEKPTKKIIKKLSTKKIL
jgi:hypothetical protein